LVGNSGAETHEVGLKPPNGWGFYDMHGNAFEWCFDLHGDTYYSVSPSGPT
jgi:formylglycine-generating enzyme required for sulfatase activity